MAGAAPAAGAPPAAHMTEVKLKSSRQTRTTQIGFVLGTPSLYCVWPVPVKQTRWPGYMFSQVLGDMAVPAEPSPVLTRIAGIIVLNESIVNALLGIPQRKTEGCVLPFAPAANMAILHPKRLRKEAEWPGCGPVLAYGRTGSKEERCARQSGDGQYAGRLLRRGWTVRFLLAVAVEVLGEKAAAAHRALGKCTPPRNCGRSGSYSAGWARAISSWKPPSWLSPTFRTIPGTAATIASESCLKTTGASPAGKV